MQTGGYQYKVPGRRADGNVSRASMANSDLPPHKQRNVELLEQYFYRKNPSMDDVVVLSGAHTLGVTRCGTFDYRLMSDQGKGMNATFRNDLRRHANKVVSLDAGSPYKFDTSYYANVLANRTVLESDAALNSPRTVAKVRELRAAAPSAFYASFAVAMGRMGAVHGGNPGKVRVNCRRVRTT